MNIGLLGGGTMGEIIVRALLQKEVVAPQEILVIERAPERERLLAGLGVRTSARIETLLPGSGVVIACVKPQDADAALEPLRGKLAPNVLVVSIMAGIDVEFLSGYLRHAHVVQSMPNLPARIGEGVTVWRASHGLPEPMRMLTKMIFQAFGRELEVDKPTLLDAATAVSGTGPAYIFYIAENLLEAAKDYGFSDSHALKLVRETFRGAMDLWVATGEAPGELRRKVTSKGGTTHAAITHFEQHDIAGIFRTGVEHALVRARELGEMARKGSPEKTEKIVR